MLKTLILLVNQRVMKNYCPKENDETKCKFQDSWATKLPWIEMNVGSDRLIHVVKCNIFLVIDWCDKILASKLDAFTKHNGKHKTNKDLKTLGANKVHGSLPSITSISRIQNGMQAITNMQYMNW
jgi:hypothetical protein